MKPNVIMKMQRRNLVLFSLLAITTLLAIFFLVRGYEVKNQLNASQKEALQAEKKVDYYRQLIAVDSLLVMKKYDQAREAYENLLNETNQFDEINHAVQLRLTNLQAMRGMEDKFSSFKGEDLYGTLMDKTRQIDSLTIRLTQVDDLHRDQLDSLSFALEKANVRTESLTRQLTGKLGRDYLKFANENGTEIHYVGEVDRKQANGWGVALYSTGSRYEGQWQNNQRHGEGVFYWPDGEYYQGNFRLNERHGQGKYFWPNGDMFSGEWENDKRNGPGTFYGKDGSVVASGTWEDNELIVKKGR